MLNKFPHKVYTKMSSIEEQEAEEFLQNLLAEMTPEDEEYMRQLLADNQPTAGPLCELVQNILDEPVPQRVKEWLPKPLSPRKNPITPQRKKKEQKRLEILKTFDPIQPVKKGEEKRYKDILRGLLGRGEELEGVEREGRPFIFWRKS